MVRPTRIDLWDIELPLRKPFVNAAGALTSRRSIMVLMRAEGFRGWGEAPIVPGHTRDTAEEAYDLMVSEAGRMILGEEPVFVEGSAGTAALDAAHLALNAHAAGKTVAEAVGASCDPVVASLAIGITSTTAELLAAVEDAVVSGYRHVKLKISHDTIKRIAAVRGEFPHLGIAADGNGEFRRRDIAMLADLDEYDLAYLEQPLPTLDIAGHAPLQDRMKAPICLDESIRRLGDIVTAATRGAARAVVLKPGRLGPTLTQRGMALAVRHGLEVKIGGLLESAIGKIHVLALAGHPLATLPADLSAFDHWFENHLLTVTLAINNGEFPQLAEVNIDRLVDRSAIRALSLRHTFVPD